VRIPRKQNAASRRNVADPSSFLWNRVALYPTEKRRVIDHHAARAHRGCLDRCSFVPSAETETSTGPTLTPALNSVETTIVGNPSHFISNSADGAPDVVLMQTFDSNSHFFVLSSCSPSFRSSSGGKVGVFGGPPAGGLPPAPPSAAPGLLFTARSRISHAVASEGAILPPLGPFLS
jgi:hypothetical protein